MNDIKIKNLWKSYDEKLDEILFLNRNLTIEVTKSKAKSMASKIKPHKYTGIILGLPWLVLVNFLAFLGIMAGGFFFPLSFILISIILYISIGIYIYHLVLVSQINKSDRVVDVQKKLAEIKSSDILVVKMSILQIPLWSIFWLDVYSDPVYLIIHGIIFIALTALTLYLFVNIKTSNMDKKWMKYLFSGSEWDSLTRANEILKEVEDLEN